MWYEASIAGEGVVMKMNEPLVLYLCALGRVNEVSDSFRHHERWSEYPDKYGLDIAKEMESMADALQKASDNLREAARILRDNFSNWKSEVT